LKGALDGDGRESSGFSAENSRTPEKIVPVVEPNDPLPFKAKKASIPKGIDFTKLTVAEAMRYLSLPRTLGQDITTGKDIVASAGRFGPYIVCDGNYRSIKPPENPYDITLEKARELLATPKKQRGFQKKVKAA
jgi:topoisomerase IA-like protein